MKPSCKYCLFVISFVPRKSFVWKLSPRCLKSCVRVCPGFSRQDLQNKWYLKKDPQTCQVLKSSSLLFLTLIFTSSFGCRSSGLIFFSKNLLQYLVLTVSSLRLLNMNNTNVFSAGHWKNPVSENQSVLGQKFKKYKPQSVVWTKIRMQYV